MPPTRLTSVTIGHWLLILLGMFLAGAGGWLAAQGFLSDWLLSRGVRRRCRKCRFDLSQSVGLRCGECGHEARSERELKRARVRWRWVAVGFCVSVLGLGNVLYAAVESTVWVWLIPRGTLAAYWPLIPHFSPTTEKRIGRTLAQHLWEMTPTDVAFAQCVREGNARALQKLKKSAIPGRIAEEHIFQSTWLLIRSGVGTGEDVLMLVTGTPELRSSLRRILDYGNVAVAWSPETKARVLGLLQSSDQEVAGILALICLSPGVQDAVFRDAAGASALRFQDPEVLAKAIEVGAITPEQLRALIDQDLQAYILTKTRIQLVDRPLKIAVDKIHEHEVTETGVQLLAELLTNAERSIAQRAASKIGPSGKIELCINGVLAATRTADHYVRQDAVRLFNYWPDKQLPARVWERVVEMLEDEQESVRASAADVAARYKDHFDPHEFIRAARSMGPGGQLAVFDILFTDSRLLTTEGFHSLFDLLTRIAEHPDASEREKNKAAHHLSYWKHRMRTLEQTAGGD